MRNCARSCSASAACAARAAAHAHVALQRRVLLALRRLARPAGPEAGRVAAGRPAPATTARWPRATARWRRSAPCCAAAASTHKLSSCCAAVWCHRMVAACTAQLGWADDRTPARACSPTTRNVLDRHWLLVGAGCSGFRHCAGVSSEDMRRRHNARARRALAYVELSSTAWASPHYCSLPPGQSESGCIVAPMRPTWRGSAGRRAPEGRCDVA